MNIGDLYAQTLAIASAGADAILVSPDTYTGFTPNDSPNTRATVGFIFHIVGDEVLSLQSDITDHYVEDNTSRQDHISLKPKRFTVSGYIGELNNVVPSILETPKEVVDRLGTLSSYIPTISIAAQRAFNLSQQAYSLAQKIKKAYQVATGTTVKTAQQTAYSKLEEYWLARTLFWVATPYGQFANMAIENLTATQSEGNKYISDFSITFKQVRFANTVTKTTSTKVETSTTSNSGSQAVA